ncbi:MAG: hypothetical protein RL368_2352 [Pseudomonadota bacterium]|jgi:hypothetical protein
MKNEEYLIIACHSQHSPKQAQISPAPKFPLILYYCLLLPTGNVPDDPYKSHA